ncbi:MAG: hypothetical protein RL173_43 [Fibrobacterota bacterium]|jgi:hypothetical protein
MTTTDADISIADNNTDNATPHVHAVNGAKPTYISVDRTELLACARRQGEPYIVEIAMDLELSAGVAVDDAFVASNEREQILKSMYPDLTYTFDVDEGCLSVEGPLQGEWIGPNINIKRDCELDQHFDVIEAALAAVAKPGAYVHLTPGWMRGVTYRAERGWANAVSLRELFQYWSLHLDIELLDALEVFGEGLERVVEDNEFGWRSSECSLIFRWVTQAEAMESRLASHALIACDVGFADDVLERLLRLGVEESLCAHEAVGKSVDAMRRMFRVLDWCADSNTRTAHLGGVVDPMTFFGLNR